MVENPSKTSKRNSQVNTEEPITKKQKITEETTNNNGRRRRRRVRLYCPVVSKTASIMVWEDERLDLGAIASVFGLQPGSLKLNGYFISRGVDLIASSVTWVSLFSFFSNKGLSTGLHSSPALVVDGKLFKSGSKRTHEPPEVDRGVHCHCTKQCEDVGVCRYSHEEGIASPKNKRLKDSSNALDRNSVAAQHCDDTVLKRRHCVEDKSPLKRVKVNGSYSNGNSLGNGQEDEGSCISKLHCGYQMSENMKRLREDDFIMTAPRKKTR